MKHFFIACLVAVSSIFTGGKIFAQTTVVIGTGTVTNTATTYPAPYGNYYFGAKHQTVVLASELTAAGMAAGNITALAFQVSVPGGGTLDNFTIRMKTTTAVVTTTTFDNSGLITVYGPQSFTDISGWNTHTFSTPFAWNGTDNLLIETCFNNTNWSQNAQIYYTTTAYNSITHFRQDISTVCTQPSGTVNMKRPNIKFTYTPNGPPTAQFTANPTNSCSGVVSFTDQSFYGVNGWLWNFGDGSTSTSQNPVHTYTASGTYSVSLQATNTNGNNTLVKPAYIHVSVGTGPMPAACTPTTTAWCCGFGITNFSFHNINNTTTDGSEGYQDYSCSLDTVTTGQTYSVSVSTLTPATHNVRVWIDLNNDGTFNATTELVFSADNSSTATGTIFIPGTATLNTALRMRVSADHSLLTAPTSCSNPQLGQVEDYAIYVKPNTNPPVANFKASDTLSCSGSITFTDQSQNIPTSWLWSFGDGGTSVSQNPIHAYAASGTYSVSLRSTNGNGNNTLVKTNYIHITLGNVPVAAACMPATFSYCCGYGIYKVQMSTINKSSADGVDGYKDYSCSDQTTLTEGQSYAIAIETNPTLTQDTKVWIDFNNDGAFTQTNELVFNSPNSINPSGTISIPLGVATYNTLLRMRVSSENSGANQSSCTNLIKGQAEDYGVKILQLLGTAEVGENEVKVKAYPNPFSDQTTLKISNPEQVISNIELHIFDMVGKEVNPVVIHNSEGFVIRRGNLNTGVYFYKMLGGNETIATGKIAIQ